MGDCRKYFLSLKYFPSDERRGERLEAALRLTEAQLTSCPTRGPDSLGFLLGSSGVFALSAVLARARGDLSEQRFSQLFRNCCQDFLQQDPLGCGSDEVGNQCLSMAEREAPVL